MSTINARLYFSLPFELAQEYFNEGLAKVAETGLHELQLNARVPATTIELSKNVMAECFPNPEDPNSWNIRWIPEPGGLYPSFEGTLSARANDEDGSTILEVTGQYTPPLGTAGAAFDHLLGRRLTSDTAHNLLLNVAAEMRVRYAFEEARHVFEEVE